MFEANLWVEGRQGKHVKDYRLLCDVISGSKCSHSACQRSRSLVKNAVAGGSASAGMIFNRHLGWGFHFGLIRDIFRTTKRQNEL